MFKPNRLLGASASMTTVTTNVVRNNRDNFIRYCHLIYLIFLRGTDSGSSMANLIICTVIITNTSFFSYDCRQIIQPTNLQPEYSSLFIGYRDDLIILQVLESFLPMRLQFQTGMRINIETTLF